MDVAADASAAAAAAAATTAAKPTPHNSPQLPIVRSLDPAQPARGFSRAPGAPAPPPHLPEPLNSQQLPARFPTEAVEDCPPRCTPPAHSRCTRTHRAHPPRSPASRAPQLASQIFPTLFPSPPQNPVESRDHAIPASSLNSDAILTSETSFLTGSQTRLWGTGKTPDPTRRPHRDLRSLRFPGLRFRNQGRFICPLFPGISALSSGLSTLPRQTTATTVSISPFTLGKKDVFAPGSAFVQRRPRRDEPLTTPPPLCTADRPRAKCPARPRINPTHASRFSVPPS